MKALLCGDKSSLPKAYDTPSVFTLGSKCQIFVVIW